MRTPIALLAVVCAAAAIGGAYAALAPAPRVDSPRRVDRLPALRPDYSQVTVPPNIAPLNFQVGEEGTAYVVRAYGESGAELEVRSRTPGIAFPLKAWRRLLDACRGKELRFDVCVRGADGLWQQFETVANRVADEPVDPYVVYRLMDPIYRVVTSIDIRQRHLESFRESVLVTAASFDGCVNCHTFLNGSPDRMVLHVRSGPQEYGAGMMLIEPDRINKIRTSVPERPGLAAFTSWHPNGQLVAFSTNTVRQFFHTARKEVRDALDIESDLAVYSFENGSVTSARDIAARDRLETFPCWSPDGRYLYFSSAPDLWTTEDGRKSTAPYDEVRYDLMRIGYDQTTGAWGELETVLSAEETGLSITQPRISPDGRLLVCCMCDYSTFPSFQPSADLYMVDLGTGEWRRMECNSPRSESWHSWSSNGRWLAFSSKRNEGQFVRVYLTYIDGNGRSHRPLVIPQRDPAFYDSFIQVHQLPELIVGPVPTRGDRIAHAVRHDEWTGVQSAITGPSPDAAAAHEPEAADGGPESLPALCE